MINTVQVWVDYLVYLMVAAENSTGLIARVYEGSLASFARIMPTAYAAALAIFNAIP